MAKSKTHKATEVKSVMEVGGYITVNQAVGMVNASGNYTDESGEGKECLPSTINYWLRSGNIDGVKLDGVLLINRKSVQEYINNLPTLAEKRKQAERKREEEARLDAERKAAIAKIEEEYKAKKAALAPGETATA